MPISNPPAATVAAATSGALGTLKINGAPTDAANPTAYVKEQVDTLLAALGITAGQILAAGGVINPMAAQYSLIVGGAAATVNEATIAKGATAYHSDTPGTNRPNWLDGNDGTGYQSLSGAVGKSVTVDLGTAKAITAYRLLQNSDTWYRTGNYRIDASDDPTFATYSTVYTITSSQWGAIDSGVVALTTPVSKRYFRITLLQGTYGGAWEMLTVEFRSGLPVGNPIELVKGANNSLLGVDGTGALAHQTAPTLAGQLTALALKASGMTGAVTPVRLVGGTADVAPTSGTFAVGDYVVTLTGKIFVCSAAGTPGTWQQVGGFRFGRPDTSQNTLLRSYTFDTTVESWSASAGTLSASGGRLRFVGGANTVALEPVGASNIADGEYYMDFSAVTGPAAGQGYGPVFRATDASNCYFIPFSLSGVELYKMVAGSLTLLKASSLIPVTAGATIRVLVRFVGSVISVYANDTLLWSVSDTTYTTGRVGVYANSQTIELDNIKLYSLPSSWVAPAT